MSKKINYINKIPIEGIPSKGIPSKREVQNQILEAENEIKKREEESKNLTRSLRGHMDDDIRIKMKVREFNKILKTSKKSLRELKKRLCMFG